MTDTTQAIPTPPDTTAQQARFRSALAALVEKVKKDKYVLAAIVSGSLSYDQVWEKSDIDLTLIGRDERIPKRDYALVEDGINVHASIISRSKFKEVIEGSIQSSFFHSLLSKSTLLFSHDETISAYFDEEKRIGGRDRQIQLLGAGGRVLPYLAKAEKWYHVKKDYPYCFLWTLKCAEALAEVEVISHHEITTREVIHQALRWNPEFFRHIYLDLMDAPKDETTLGAALKAINEYLRERTHLMFQSVLDHLAEAGGARTISELSQHFTKRNVEVYILPYICEWLADEGIIDKVGVPLRLTDKSIPTVDEAAYYYDGPRGGES
jgi:uncharacterized protein